MILINPGDDLAAAILANPGGSFLLTAGTHRLTTGVTPTDGQSFYGIPGSPGSATIASTLTTVVSGARLLTSWTNEGGGVWSKSGQTQAGTVGGGVCLAGYPRCNYPEDVFRDDVLLTAVATLGALASGKSFFDYAADKIYIADDPTGHVMETSLAPSAMEGFARNITIRYLEFQKFATPTTVPVINILGYVNDMGLIIDRCLFRWNHFAGFWSNGTALNTGIRSCYNGCYGAVGAGQDNLVVGCELDHNNTCGYDPGWGAGAGKWVFSTRLTLRNNYVHDNKGVGLWADIDNVDTTFEDNLVVTNEWAGIFEEISFGAIIRRNTCIGNGYADPFPGYVTGAGILVSCSSDVEVYDNVCHNNLQGIAGLEDHRGSGTLGPYALTDLYVHDNQVTTTAPITIHNGRIGVYDSAGTGAYQPAANNRFRDNHYTLTNPGLHFFWEPGEVSNAAWLAIPMDDADSFVQVTPGAIGASWASGSWEPTAWADDSWADGVAPPSGGSLNPALAGWPRIE